MINNSSKANRSSPLSEEELYELGREFCEIVGLIMRCDAYGLPYRVITPIPIRSANL